MAEKARDAFRTISEVANWLDIPAHVLRFWESKFPQIKPVKRAGGRRYYRPADMQLIGGIKKLLHDDGLTIRGVQKMIKEDGVKAVAALSPELDMPTESEGAARRKARRARRAARQSVREKRDQAPADVAGSSDDPAQADSPSATEAPATPDDDAEAPFTHVEVAEDTLGGDNVVALNGGGIAEAISPDAAEPDDAIAEPESAPETAQPEPPEQEAPQQDAQSEMTLDAPAAPAEEEPQPTAQDRVEAIPAPPEQPRPAMLDNPFMPQSKPSDDAPDPTPGAPEEDSAPEAVPKMAGEPPVPPAPVPADPDPSEVATSDAHRIATERLQKIRRLGAGTELATNSDAALTAAFMRLRKLRDRVAADIAKH
jgi:DNA-binding transcriptional MerR regulator